MPATTVLKLFKLYKSLSRPVRLILASSLLGLTGIVLLQGITVSVLVCWLLLVLSGIGIISGLLSLPHKRLYTSGSKAGIACPPEKCTEAASKALPAIQQRIIAPERQRQAAGA